MFIINTKKVETIKNQNWVKMAKYIFLVDYKNYVKKGQVLEGRLNPGKAASGVFKAKPASVDFSIEKILNGKKGYSYFSVPQSEIGKTIKKVDDSIQTNTKPLGVNESTNVNTSPLGKTARTTQLIFIAGGWALIYYIYKKNWSKSKGWKAGILLATAYNAYSTYKTLSSPAIQVTTTKK